MGRVIAALLIMALATPPGAYAAPAPAEQTVLRQRGADASETQAGLRRDGELR